MKIRKIVIAILMALALIVLLRGTTYAAGSFSASLTSSASDRVPLGGTFKVTLKISSIKVDQGISGITGVLNYNDDIVELVNDKVEGLNGFAATYNKDNGKLALDSAEATKNDTEIATFTFKVKDRTSAKVAQIEFNNIEGGNSDPNLTDPIKISSIKTVVSVGGNNDPSESTEPSESPSESPSPSQSTSTTPSSSSRPSASQLPGTGGEEKTQSPSAPTTRAEQDMPSTGSEDYIIPLMIAIAALGLISFVNYKKID